MDDKTIKQMLKDAGLYLGDASKRWPHHKDTAYIRFNAAVSIIEEIMPIFEEWAGYVERPLGGKGGEGER